MSRARSPLSARRLPATTLRAPQGVRPGRVDPQRAPGLSVAEVRRQGLDALSRVEQRRCIEVWRNTRTPVPRVTLVGTTPAAVSASFQAHSHEIPPRSGRR